MMVFGGLFGVCATVFAARLPGLRRQVRERYAALGDIP
jgi:hypothetical protein